VTGREDTDPTSDVVVSPHAQEAETARTADSDRRLKKRNGGADCGPEGCGRQAEVGAEEAELETAPHCVHGVFRRLKEESKRRFDVQKSQRSRVIEGYRQGDVCLLVDLDVRELGNEKPSEYTAVFYRQGRHPGVKRQRHSFGANDDGACPEHGWDDDPVLVHYREPVQGSQIMPVPTLVWLYRRFEYVDQILGKVWLFRSLCDGLLKGVRSVGGWEIDVLVGLSRISHDNGNREVQCISQIVNHVADDRREFIMREHLFSSHDPDNIPGLALEVRDDPINLKLHKTLQESVQLQNVRIGPL